jgi:hypothetical protein
MSVEPRFEQTAIRTDLGAIFVSLELSRSVWLITSLSPGAGETMSKHSVRGGDVAGLLMRFAHLREKAHARTGLLRDDLEWRSAAIRLVICCRGRTMIVAPRHRCKRFVDCRCERQSG